MVQSAQTATLLFFFKKVIVDFCYREGTFWLFFAQGTVPPVLPGDFRIISLCAAIA